MAKSIRGSKPPRNPKRHKERGLLTLTGHEPQPDFERAPYSRPSRDPIEARTERQHDLIQAVSHNTCTFATGPAGVGKTYLAAALAAEALLNGDVERIIITRPAVEAEEKLGFLPGDFNEKYAPYLAPFRTELEKRLGRGGVEMFLKNGRIEPIPFAYMRGRNMENAFVILDEAQNVTPNQMKLFLTRICEGSTVIIDGDITQKDIPGPSGLTDALHRLQGMQGVAHIDFSTGDIVRSGFVQEVVERYAS